MKLRVFVPMLASVLLLAGCSGISGSGSAVSSTTPETTATAGALPNVSGEFGKEPKISEGIGQPPSDLKVSVLHQGDGPQIAENDTITVNYYGQLWNGKYFDGSFKRGEPATFPLTGVIKGWTQGITGHHVGDRLLLVVPPALGYGEAGQPPTIPPNSTLVFVVDILNRTSAEEAAKKQEEESKKQSERAALIAKLAPVLVKQGREAQSTGEVLHPQLPSGIEIKNVVANAPEIKVEKSANVSSTQFFELIRGAGSTIPNAKQVLVNLTVSNSQGQNNSTWDDAGSRLQVVDDVARLEIPEVDLHYGSRVARISKDASGNALVSVIDFMAAVPDDLQ